jgi:ribosomal protein S18 acetylase RimI-like enzyme
VGDAAGIQGRPGFLSRQVAGLSGRAERLTVARIARPGAELLSELENYDFEAFGETGLRIYDLAVMAEAGAILLAYVDEEIVGGCQLLRVYDEPEYFYMVGFYVRPGWQGRGLGRRFFLAVAEEIRSAGAAGMVLTVLPGNERALRLYQSLGFVDESYVPDFYGRGEDRHILRCRFGQGGLHGSV